MIPIYAAMENMDKNEGRGPVVPVGFFTSKADAIEANGLVPGVMGGWNDCLPREYILYDSVEEFADNRGCETTRDKSLRAKALKKLTKDERRVMGIKE